MDIKRLTHFIALAEEGRFSRAAMRVHLSQAAFSRSIQTLEQQMGLRLFDRGQQGAQVTRVGELMLRRARALVFDSSCLQRDIELVKTGDAGELAIGAAPVPAATIVPRLLGQLGRDSPQLIARVRFGNLFALLEQLEDHTMDFCMGEPRLIGKNARYEMCALSRHVGDLYCRKGHPLARKGVVDADALRRYGVALISMSSEIREAIAAGYGFASASDFPLTLECDDMGLIARQVADSNVLGLLPQGLSVPGVSPLRSLHFEGAPPVVVHVHAIWLKGRTLSPSALRAVRLAQQIGKEAQGDRPGRARQRPA